MQSFLRAGQQVLGLRTDAITSLVELLTRRLGESLTDEDAQVLISMFESMLEVEGQNGSLPLFSGMVHRLLDSQALSFPVAGLAVDEGVVSCRDLIAVLESRYECKRKSRAVMRGTNTTTSLSQSFLQNVCSNLISALRSSTDNNERPNQATYVQPNHPRYGQTVGPFTRGVGSRAYSSQARTNPPIQHQLGNTRASVSVERPMYPEQFVPDSSQLRPFDGPVSLPSSFQIAYGEGQSMPNINTLPQASVEQLWQGHQPSGTVIPSSMGSLAHGVARGDTTAQYHPHNHSGYVSNVYGGFTASHHGGQYTNGPQNGAGPSGSGGGWM
jgi:hypothetical protein